MGIFQICLLLLVAGFCFSTDLRGWITRWVMLFTQNSTQSLQGYLVSSDMPFCTAVFLNFFHTAFLSWYPPRIYIAGAFCLGKWVGILAAVLGSMLTWTMWFMVGKLVFPNGIRVLRQPLAVTVGIVSLGAVLLFGNPLPLIALSAALLQGSFLGGSVGVMAAVCIRSLLYSGFCSLYTAYLPKTVNSIILFLGGILILLGILYERLMG